MNFVQQGMNKQTIRSIANKITLSKKQLRKKLMNVKI